MLIMELFNFIDRGAGGVIVIIFHPMKLHEATDCFKEELGKESFRAVYKGTLPVAGGTKIVAIKKLENVEYREREFQKEMTAIKRFRVSQAIDGRSNKHYKD